MSALHDPSEELNGLGRLWMPRPYTQHCDLKISISSK
jgi:hypothetical protein